MGCGAAKPVFPGNTDAIRVRHELVLENASPFTRVKAYDAIKNNDVFLVEKILQEIPANENLSFTGENNTCLHVAAKQNSFQAMKTLLAWLRKNKSSEMEQILQIQNIEGHIPAVLCIINDSSETFYVMLNEKAVQLDYKNKKGQSLTDICQQYSANCLGLLVKHDKPAQEIKTNKAQEQPNQHREAIVVEQDPSDHEKHMAEKHIETIVAKVERAHVQTNDEINNLKSTDSTLQGVPINSELYKILSKLIETGGEFKDPNFPAQLSSILTAPTHKYMEKFKKAIWRRPHELFSCGYDQISVFETIDANDISQGILGVCYLLSSLSALTEFPSRLTKMYLNKTANKHGVYGLQFYVRGIPTEIIVDDYFPCSGGQKRDPLFSKPKGKELWVLLAEKAWAKLYKNYVVCEAGFMDEALEYMLGVPAVRYVTKKQEPEEIFKILTDADASKYTLCAGTYGDVSEKVGLVAGHAYSIISVHNLGKYNVLKMRNPWGKFEWNGDFGDGSSLWSDEIKARVGFTNADDGIFCMTVEDFKKYFEFYTVAIYNEGWEYSYLPAESFSNHAKYFRFHVDRPCEVYFRIHQDDKRNQPLEKQESYQYTSGDLIVARVEADGTYKPVLEKGDDVDSSSLWGDRSIFPSKHYKLTLTTPGDYIIRTKMRWPVPGQKEKFTLSAYSNFKINLEKIKPLKNFLHQFFTNIGRNGKKNKMAEGCEMSYAFYSHYLYLYFENKTHKKWVIDIDFTKFVNLRLSKPFEKTAKSLHVEVPAQGTFVTHIKKINVTEATSYGWSVKHSLH